MASVSKAFFGSSDGDPVPAHAPTDFVFLASANERDWTLLLEACERRRFRAGETVLREGKTDRSLSILTEGRLAFYGAGIETSFEVIIPPTVIGEVSFFDEGPRMGTLKALDDGELLRLSFASFTSLSAQVPHLGQAILIDCGRIMAHRLRAVEVRARRL